MKTSILAIALVILAVCIDTASAQVYTDTMTITATLDSTGAAPDSITYRTQEVYDARNRAITYDSTYFNDPRAMPAAQPCIAQVWRFTASTLTPITVVIEEMRVVGSDSAWVPLPLKYGASGYGYSYSINDAVATELGATVDSILTGVCEVALPVSGGTATRVRRTSAITEDHALRCEQLRREDNY